MEPLELSYDDMNAVPEAFRGLYTEKGGKAVLTHINGMKTQADVSAVQEGLRKEREDHTATKELLKPFKGLDATETRATLARIAELETAAGGKLDDEAINKIVEARIAQKTAPLQLQIEELTTANGELTTTNGELTGTIQTRDRNSAIRKVAAEMKVHSTAMPDIELVAGSFLELDEHSGQYVVKQDAKGVTVGADIKQFMKEMQQQRPHWWPASEGGGAQGDLKGINGGNNPFKGDTWNSTQQGQMFRSDPTLAKSMAEAAGTSIGGPRPAPAK